MITVPAHRVKQFGVEFFQASFSAKDIERLVKFEVLGYAGAEAPAESSKRATTNRARVGHRPHRPFANGTLIAPGTARVQRCLNITAMRSNNGCSPSCRCES